MLKSKMKQLFTAIAISSAVALAPMGAQAASAADLEAGKKLAFSKKKGNCLACHWVQGANQPGNIGPGLIMMKARYKSKQALEDKIYGKTKPITDSMMPPFGQNGILSDKEIKLVTDYIYSL